jgi:hypothetical protein
MCKWYESVPKESGPIKKEVLRVEGRGKLLNRSCIDKCNDHHQLIMRVERMKNHGARITYTLHPLSFVLYMPLKCTRRAMCYEKSSVRFETSSRHEFSVPGTIPPLARSVINYGCSACILFTSQAYALFVILLASPG